MKKFKLVAAMCVLALTTACAGPNEKEFYSSQYTSNDSCSWTHVTCYAGDKLAQNVIYEDNVCRYYFNFGELSVAHGHDQMVRNVVLTRNENCVFERLL